MNKKNQTFLFISHLSSGMIIREFKNIRRSTNHLGDAFFLYDASKNIIPERINNLSTYLYSNTCLSSLGYPTIGQNIIPGHAHFPLFQFFLDKPDYDYYWVIEYDVRFSGEWRYFFNSFLRTNTDFLTCHIRSYADEPYWPWWELSHPRESIPLHERLRSFNPIYRISNDALSFLHQAFRSGWCGHHEVALPTLLHHNGFTIQDISGEGKYAVPNIDNEFYSSSESNDSGELSSGTMRYRPVIWRYGHENNKLYHPVKPLTKTINDNLSYHKRIWSVRLFGGFAWGGNLISKIIYRPIYSKNKRQPLIPQQQLSYFVLNILDHCNLRCRGCDHFSAIAEERFVSLNDIKKDLVQMAKILNGDVARIGVMGGEPLLHPQLKEMLIYTRLFFPKTLIQLVTNGLLLLRQDEEFWRICREKNIVIVNTKYPINLDYEAIKETVAKHGVVFEHYQDTGESTKTSYKIPLDIEGHQDHRKSFVECFHANACPLLMEGKLYSCTVAPNVRHFNKRFGTHMELGDGDSLDIYSVKKASELLNFLSRPKPFCRYCNVSNRSYGHKWERSKQEISEWIT
jgi:organic radical activating enzyme